MPRTITLTPRSSKTPMFASVHDALRANVPVIAALIREGERLSATHPVAGAATPATGVDEQRVLHPHSIRRSA